MTLKQLLENSSEILQCPSTELRVDTRLLKSILDDQGNEGMKEAVQQLATKIRKESELDAKVLPSGALLLKKR